ncbi:MAG: S8 family serine peptidase [Symbiobacteriia bacterium]
MNAFRRTPGHRLTAWLTVASLVVGLLGTGATALAQGSSTAAAGITVEGGRVRAGRIIVAYDNAAPASDRIAAMASVQGRLASAGGSASLVELPAGADVQASLQQLRGARGVRYAEPDYVRLTVAQAVYDPQQWAMGEINAGQAWTGLGASGTAPVTVAVVDSGVDVLHPDLQGRIANGYDFIHGTAITASDTTNADDNGHGTHVAGIIAATGAQGITGLAGTSASPNVKVMPVKVMNADGTGDDFTIAQGIRWAADNGARIINLSLGGTGYSQTLAEAVLYAQSKGALVVAAAGNDNLLVSHYFPAALPNVLTVAAEDNPAGPAQPAQPGDHVLANFSNYGPEVEIAAPGVGIWSTVPANVTSNPTPDQWAPWDGTSMATPLVAGTAALVAAEHPGYTGSQLFDAVVQGASTTLRLTQPSGGSIPVLDANGAVLLGAAPATPLLTFGAPAAGEAVSGLTRVTVAADASSGVASVRVSLDGAQILDLTAPVNGIFSGSHDFSQVAGGSHTLAVAGYDAAGSAITGATATVTVRVANTQASGLAIKVLQPNGQPAGSAVVDVYHVSNGLDSWLDSYRTNQQGVVELPSSATPDGNTYLLLVSGRQEEEVAPGQTGFVPYFYYRTVAAPGAVTVDGSQSHAVTVTATDSSGSGVNASFLSYLTRPGGSLAGPYLDLASGGSRAYLDQGLYDLVAYNIPAGYLWTATGVDPATSSSIVLDGAQTSSLTVAPQGTPAGTAVKMRLMPALPAWVPEPVFDASAGPVRVTPGDYYFGFALRIPDASGDGSNWYYDLSGDNAAITVGGDQTLQVAGTSPAVGSISLNSGGSDLTPSGYVMFDLSFQDAFQHELRDVRHVGAADPAPNYWADSLYDRKTQSITPIDPAVTITPSTLIAGYTDLTEANFDIPGAVYGSFSAQGTLSLTTAGAPWGGDVTSNSVTFDVTASPATSGPTVHLQLFDPSSTPTADAPHSGSVSATILRPYRDAAGSVQGYDPVYHPAYSADATGLILDDTTALQKDDVVVTGFGFVLIAHTVTQADLDALTAGQPIPLGHAADMSQVTFTTDTLGLSGLDMEWVSPANGEGVVTYTESWTSAGSPAPGPQTATGWFSPGQWNFARINDADPNAINHDPASPNFLLVQAATVTAGGTAGVGLNKADAATATLVSHAMGTADTVTRQTARLGLPRSYINDTFEATASGTPVLLLPGTYDLLGEISRTVPESQGGSSDWYFEVTDNLTLANSADAPRVDLGGAFGASLSLNKSTYGRGETVSATASFQDGYGHRLTYADATPPSYVGYRSTSQFGAPSAAASQSATPDASSRAFYEAMAGRAHGFAVQNHRFYPYFSVKLGTAALFTDKGADHYQSGSWTVPSDAAGGSYTASVGLDIGPEAAVTASSTFSVTLPPAPPGGGSTGGGGAAGGGAPKPPAPTPDRAEADLTDEGGTVATSDEQVRLDLPRGALSGDTKITITKVEAPAAMLASGTPVADVFSFDAGGITFKAPVQVSFHYDPSKLVDAAEFNIGIYRYDETSGQWVYVGGRVNPSDHTVTTFLNHFSTYAAIATSSHFPDMTGHWAEGDVAGLAVRHIISGRPDGSFDPQGNVTRAELAKMLVRVRISQQGAAFAEAPGSSAAQASFSDVSVNDWFAGDVATAALHGIVRGADGRFRPGDSVTREELAVMVIRALGADRTANGLSPAEVSATLSFTDASQVSDWAAGGLALAVKWGILRGSDGRLSPQGIASRAEAAAMLGRMIKFMEGENAVNLTGTLSLSTIEGSHYELVAGGATYVLLLDAADADLTQQLASLLNKTVRVMGYKLGGYTTYQRGQAVIAFSLQAAS